MCNSFEIPDRLKILQVFSKRSKKKDRYKIEAPVKGITQQEVVSIKHWRQSKDKRWTKKMERLVSNLKRKADWRLVKVAFQVLEKRPFYRLQQIGMELYTIRKAKYNWTQHLMVITAIIAVLHLLYPNQQGRKIERMNYLIKAKLNTPSNGVLFLEIIIYAL